MRQLCKNFLINWTICENRWANSRNAQRAACHIPPLHHPSSPRIPIASYQLQAASCCYLVAARERRCVGISIHMSCQTIAPGRGGQRQRREGRKRELTRRQPTYLCRAESSCNYETETQTQPPGSSSSSTCCLDWWPRSLGCCWGCCCCCCCWLWLYTSCGQTTQYINSPALAYFILRKKIMANIRELCDAAHQRESARHDR